MVNKDGIEGIFETRVDIYVFFFLALILVIGGLKNFCNIIISMDYAKKFFPDFQFILECRSLIILTTLPMYIVHIIEFFF